MPTNLKQTRLRLGLTQQALADALTVSKRTVCRWEAGREMHWIYVVKLDRIIAAHHTRMQQLEDAYVKAEATR